MPVFQRKLQQLLLLKQSKLPDEIIIADDGSLYSREIMSNYSKKIEKVLKKNGTILRLLLNTEC